MRSVEFKSIIAATVLVSACSSSSGGPTGSLGNTVGTAGGGTTATGSGTGGSEDGIGGASTNSAGGTEEPAAGSGGAAAGGETGEPGPVMGTDNPGDSELLVGTFTLTLVDENTATTPPTPALSQIQGFVRDAPTNLGTVWELSAEEGPCRLEVPRFPSCDPECTGEQTCVDDDTCANDPNPNDVGTVTVYGLATQNDATNVELNPIGASSNYSASGSTRIEYPPAPEGAEIRLVSEGVDYDPFEVTTHGLAPLEVTTPTPVAFTPDMPTVVEWTPSGADGDSTITALVDISHHGGSKGRIICADIPDTGSLELSGEFVGQLIELGTAGGPTIRLARNSVGSTTIEVGRVDFLVTQSRELPLEIPGLITCIDTPCPEGMTCALNKACVEE